MLLTDEDAIFLMETKNVSPTHVNKLRIFEPDLHLLQETSLVRSTKLMIEIKLVNFHETFNYEAVKGKKTAAYRTVSKLVCRVVA